jgi:hypothetical protein
MKTLIQIHKEGKYFIAIDMITNVVVTMPNHPELAKGTLISIMKQARLEKKEFIAALKE